MKNIITPNEMLKKGGSWLGEAREFLQWNTFNGDIVTWGSDDLLRFNTGISVKQFEEFVAKVAADAINDYIEQNRVTEFNFKK